MYDLRGTMYDLLRKASHPRNQIVHRTSYILNIMKLILFVVITTIIMAVSWAVGNGVGNALTNSMPPPPTDAAGAGMIFLLVCVFNSVLIAILLGTTSRFSGTTRRLALVSYVFTIQFLLPQMETFF